MVKIVYCITRKPGLSEEEFHRYWKETHGPIAARIPGLRRYVQSHTHAASAELGPVSYDGVAELWFDDLDSLRSAMASPEVAAALEDEKNFIDHSRVALFLTEEHVVVGEVSAPERGPET
ncbi:MAG: EthD domain-containing protein [Candidatus Binatia bacterium]